MLSLASSLLTTIQGVLSGNAPAAWSVDDRLDHIRQVMLDSLDYSGGLFLSPLERRVMFAPDAESLWYLRPELLMALADTEGEAAARKKIAGISQHFAGLLPQALLAPPVGRER